MSKDKEAQLQEIAAEVAQLKESPLYQYRQQHHYKSVPGEGDADANIMFIGEAPGKQEAKSGRPFVGAAGRILDELLQTAGISRQDVFITNIVKDRPPDNRDPHREEIERYAPFLRRQIEIIQPAVIATLGRFAMEFILAEFNLAEKGQKISRLHGQRLKARAPYGQITIIPLFHPAVALYNKSRKSTLKDDFQLLKLFV